VFFVIARASNPRRRNAIFDVSDGDFALEINHQRDRQKVIPFSFSRSARRGPKHTAHTHTHTSRQEIPTSLFSGASHGHEINISPQYSIKPNPLCATAAKK